MVNVRPPDTVNDPFPIVACEVKMLRDIRLWQLQHWTKIGRYCTIISVTSSRIAYNKAHDFVGGTVNISGLRSVDFYVTLVHDNLRKVDATYYIARILHR